MVRRRKYEAPVREALAKGIIDQPFSCVVAADAAASRKHDVYVLDAPVGAHKPQLVFEFKGPDDVHLADSCENALIVVDGVLVSVFTDKEQAKVQWIDWSRRKWKHGKFSLDLQAPAVQVTFWFSHGRHNSMYTVLERGTFEAWGSLSKYWASTHKIQDKNTVSAMVYTSTGVVDPYGSTTTLSSRDKSIIRDALQILRDEGWERL